jgi:hypothetical protein
LARLWAKSWWRISPAGPSGDDRDHAISEIVFGSGGEDPFGPGLKDAERLLDQG